MLSVILCGMSLPLNTIVQGDCLTVMRGWPSERVDMCLTSPPYWGLRDYGVAGQLGLEASPELYVQHLVEVFREVRRVLKLHGTLWLNLGDSYASSTNGGNKVQGNPEFNVNRPSRELTKLPAKQIPFGLKPKDLVGIPWRVAFALQTDGWWLRSDIIWSKPNPMPESVTDRPTKAHEYLFLLAKNQHYYFDQEAVRENPEKTYTRKGASVPLGGVIGEGRNDRGRFQQDITTHGRNVRSVWTIPTQPFKGAHFATFPERLCEVPVKAGCPQQVCKKCGKPRERITNHVSNWQERRKHGAEMRAGNSSSYQNAIHGVGMSHDLLYRSETVGWSNCGCGAGFESGIVLDPFAGAGTVAVVARKLNRRYVGIELNEDYVRIARERLGTELEKFVK